MSKNEFQHVRSGEPVVIPAATYNAMLDAAEAHRNRKMNLSRSGTGFESLFVHVVNTTGRFLERFDVVGLDGPTIMNNLDAFCERIVFNGVVPKKIHRGKFAVLQEDAAPDMCVRACVYGTTVAKIRVTPSKDGSPTRELIYCGIEENQTSFLVPGGHTEVLWSDERVNERWSIIRIGSGRSTLFPVKLEKVGGEQGDSEKAASWTYSVTDATTEEKLEEETDPCESPHEWKRPEYGAMSEATFGYAHYDKENQLVLGWINEIPEVAICGEEGEEEE